MILSIILALGVLIILGYRESDVKVLPLYRTSSMQKLHLIHKEGNKIKWELMAHNATLPEGNKEIIIKSLKLKIHNDPEIFLTGGSGIYKIEGRTLTINKPEINIEDAKFITDALTWNGEKGLISTEDSVKFSGRNFLIEGIGLTANIRHQKIKILKDVKGIFNL